ncbi:MAG: RelA/SpoT domain-containing protein [Elusimicrobia bacterium]|nr:RelA/SpoT domain-containing protein [Elusimicrobiota bacterium]
MPSKEELIAACVHEYTSNHDKFDRFQEQVKAFFSKNSKLNSPPLPVIHSIKSRVKNPDHLAEKIQRKWTDESPLTNENLFSKITDLAGVRVLHLHQQQFSVIHAEIMKNVNIDKEWVFVEPPVAYTWDREAIDYYKKLELKCDFKESHYTSIHYIVKPNIESKICCEIQVRTLFEEIWGEIDHSINYPHPTDSVACKEQLRVLAKLVNAGTRLGDSIFRSYEDHISHK